MNSKQSHCKMILDYVLEHGKITPMEAIVNLGCLRLAARIADLQKVGYQFEHRMVYTVNDKGKHIRYMEYRMVA